MRSLRGRTEQSEAAAGKAQPTLSEAVAAPAVESIRKCRRPRGFFKKMNDDELVAYAQRIIDEKGIRRSRKELASTDNGLYLTLLKRKLGGRIKLAGDKRPWSGYPNEELVAHAQNFVDEKGIKNPTGLAKACDSLYRNLKRRGLLDKVNFKEGRNSWISMGDSELIEVTQRLVDEKGISGKGNLGRVQSRLHYTLRKRGLLGEIKFKKAEKAASPSDEELVASARRFVEENGIPNRSGLQRAAKAMYNRLLQRKLIDRVIQHSANSGRRNWAALGDDEIVAFAQRFVDERQIKNPTKVRREASGLYGSLKRRKLLNWVNFGETHGRPRGFFKRMGDDELVEYAQRIVGGEGIRSRKKLSLVDNGLYGTLLKRNLENRVKFPADERVWSRHSPEGLVAYAQRIVDERGITRRVALQRADNALYQALRIRKLIDRLTFKEGRGKWASLEERALVAFAQGFVDENRLKNRYRLEKAASGLYHALLKRKLMERLKFPGDARAWRKYSDEELVEHAQRFIEREGIKCKNGLAGEDSGLFGALLKRKLLEKLGFEGRGRHRNWAGKTDKELIAQAKRLVEEKKIKNRRGLEKADIGLCNTLRARKLIDLIGLEKKARTWDSMDDDGLVAYAQKFIEENRIPNKGRFGKLNNALYQALRRRMLLDEVKFGKGRVQWSLLGSRELVAEAQRIVDGKGIMNRTEFNKQAPGLCNNLRILGLLNKVRFGEEEKVVALAQKIVIEEGILDKAGLAKHPKLYRYLRKRRLLVRLSFGSDVKEPVEPPQVDEAAQQEPAGEETWKPLGRKDFLERARNAMRNAHITERWQLRARFSSLYDILKRRKLLDELFPRRKAEGQLDDLPD